MAKENRTMRILTAIGIMLIVAGHLKLDYFEFGGIFSYYSFHVYIFLFVAGYFYSEKDEKDVVGFLLRKTKKLLIPYYILHLLAGIISTLLNLKGIHVGGTVSVMSVIIDPFLGGHMFMLDFPGWFVPALFVVEIMNLFMQKLVRKLSAEYTDIICFAISLILGIGTAYLSIGGHIWGYRQTPARWLIMLFGIEFGYLFKRRIEPLLKGIIDKNKDKVLFIYFALLLLIILIQLPIWYISGGLAYSVVWCKSFANGPIIPFVTAMTGILFWLLIAKIISLLSEDNMISKALVFIGRNSFGIMMGHMTVLFGINSVFYLMNTFLGKLPEFDIELYKGDVNYQYLYAGWHGTHVINFILLMVITVAISVFVKNTQKRLRHIG